MQRSIRFPDDLAEKIQAIAESEDRTFSYVVVRAMERALGDATGDRIPERPAPPRSTSPEPEVKVAPFIDEGRLQGEKKPPKAKPSKRPDKLLSGAATLRQYDRAIREGQQAALARQQALNKPKGI